MTVKERIIEFAKTKERSVRAFEMKTGLTIGYINTIRVSIQPDKLQKITTCYSDLNTEWLLTGEGNMVKPSKNPFSQMTEREMEDINAFVISEELTKAYKRGEIYPAEVHNRIIAEKDKKIEELQKENWELRREVTELRKKE